jgi:hypothetical protein
MAEKKPAISMRLTDEDNKQVAEAKRIIKRKGVKVSTTDALKAALYFFVEKHGEEKSAEQPTSK